MNKIREFFQRLFSKKPIIRLYISAERQMNDEDRKNHRDIIFETSFQSIEKGLIIRIGEHMDIVFNDKTSEVDTKCAKVCVNLLKDILLEWKLMREEFQEEDKEQEEELQESLKPTIRT